MVGPPGTGKSMLAQRLPGLLPPMTQDEALESAALLSLAGRFDAARWRHARVRAPHHSASPVALVGGGSPPRPGEISLAHHGVLFLDELPEFPRAALEALREPLETGRIIDLARGAPGRVPGALPARRGDEPVPLRPPRQPAARLPLHARRGRALPGPHLSGPLLDRIDLQVEVPAVAPQALPAPPTASRARRWPRGWRAPASAQLARQGCSNAALAGDALDAHAAPDAAGPDVPAGRRVAPGLVGAQLPPRAAHGAHVADLAGSATMQVAHLAEAIQYRRVLAGQ